uniref:LRRCT domain-containing protein n=1 Tax=Timema genevievae TaxID=629358 RepID=A0A7R9PI00_TIMGE|nr:unnamed protein product [Timema genevievae]
MAVWLLLLLMSVSAHAHQPCPELHRDLRYPCRCEVTAADEILMECDRVVGEMPALPYQAPIVSFQQRWAGLHALPTQPFTAAAIPLRALDLSGNSLRRLADRLLLGLHETLEELLLADNLLGDNLNPIFSSSEFHGLTNLRILDLSGNLIKGVEEGILKGCDNLQELHLDRNSLPKVPSSSLNGPKALRVLSLTENRISSVAANSFFAQTSLEKIDLGTNMLVTLEGGAFSGLVRLRELNLGRNKFTRFNSDVFQGAENMEKLDLSENFISEIPNVAFKAFTNLKFLNLSSNLIQSLDSANLALQPGLERLDFSRNNIANIAPGTFLGLRQLKHLDISLNALRTVEDDAFEGLENLESLSLKDNNILLIPASALGRLPHLSVLQMDFNRVAALSGDILRSVAGQVTSLSLARNVVRELPQAAFQEFKNLVTLDLTGNLLNTISPSTFTGLKQSLQTLYLGQNRLKNLQYIDISGNAISAIVNGDFDGLESLRYLKMYELDECTLIEKNAFKPLGNLLQLVSYGYPRLGYMDVHGILQNLPSLEVLDIEVKDAAVSSDQLAPVLHPRLKEFSVRGPRVYSLSSGALAGLKAPSVVVGLRNTSLTALPPALFFTMPRSTLITLDVSGSKLSALSPQFLAAVDERRGDLKLVGLDSNPIICDCGARALRRWLPGAGMTGIRCSSPETHAGKLLVEIADDVLTCDSNHPTSTLAPSSTTSILIRTSSKSTTEPDIIWSMPPSSKDKTPSTKATGIINKATPTVSATSLNNDDTLIIGIVGGVVAFIAILIIIICIVRLRISNNQYQGGPLANPAALSAPSMIATSNGCTCVKPPLYMAQYGPTYAATLPAKMIPPTSNSPGLRPTYATMGRQPYYQTPPYYISYPSEEKEHR